MALWSRHLRVLVLAPALIHTPAPAVSQEGYTLTDTAVVVATAEDWAAWDIPEGSALLSRDGRVAPRWLARDVNPILDMTSYETVLAGDDTVRGGISSVGSGQETAPRAVDGNPTTYWEPQRDSPVTDWFLEVDLGRSVVAEQVRVRFAPPGSGDPFLKFRVMVSDGVGRFDPQVDMEYYRAGQVIFADEERRDFLFDIKPRRPLPEGVTGDIVQIVRVEALDSDGPRGAEVNAEAYAALPPEDRGAIDYYRQTVAGRQILVDEETWQALPAAERGPVRYYRWERARLAELEVVTPGENIVLVTQRIVNRETSIFADIVRYLSTDGQVSSGYPLRFYDELRDANQLEIDLGAKYWLDRVRIIATEKPMSAYQVLLSAGGVDPTGERVWEPLDERLNRGQFRQLEERFPLQEVRHIQVRRLQLVGSSAEGGNISELHAYGEGYVSEITLTSPMVRLPGSRMFTDLSWEGDAPNDTRIEIRTRSGDDLIQETHYYDVYDREITEQQWLRAPERNRGPARSLDLPGPKWSSWSELYREPGEAFRSPSPRRFALVQVRLRTTNPARRPDIGRLRIGLAPPLVDQVLAELWPIRDVAPGVDQEFTLYLRTQRAAGDPGFDRLGLRSTSSAPIELLSLRVGVADSQAVMRGDRDALAAARVLSSADGGVEILFDDTHREDEVIVARFRTRLFLSGTTFQASLGLSARPGVVQLAAEGDAVPPVGSESLVVLSDLRAARLLDALTVVPAVLTPNGDGINDETTIRFEVYQLRGERRLGVSIHDLRGFRVRDLSQTTPGPSGGHDVVWNGRDEAGRRVPPGIYAVRVRIQTDADADGAEGLRLVHVVY